MAEIVNSISALKPHPARKAGEHVKYYFQRGERPPLCGDNPGYCGGAAQTAGPGHPGVPRRGGGGEGDTVGDRRQ